MKSYDLALITKKIYDSPLELYTLKTLRDMLAIRETSSLFNIIKRLTKSGIITKIERNKYILKKYTVDDMTLANFIYGPSYISFESALSYYGILPQFPYEITSATIKQTRAKVFNGKRYGYYRIKKELFWGYEKKDNYLIADKEKALADQLYLASKGLKKIHLEEYDLSLIGAAKLKTYLLKYPRTRQFNKTIFQLAAISKYDY